MSRTCVVCMVVVLSSACVADVGEHHVTQPVAIDATVAASTTAPSVPATTSTSLPPTTTLPPIPETMVIGDGAMWAAAPLAFGPDGLPVFVIPAQSEVDGVWQTSIVVGTCADARCATGVQSATVWSEPIPENHFVEVGRTGAWFGHDGTLLISFELLDFFEGVENEMEALTQYALVCDDPSCSGAVLTEIGPIEYPSNPAGADPVSVYAGAVSDEGRTYLAYLTQNQSSFELELRLHDCGVESGCKPDPTFDPLLYAVPNDDSGVSLAGMGGDATVDAGGVPLPVLGVHLEGKPSQIMLASCDSARCESPTRSWITTPDRRGFVDGVRVAIGSSGNPILAQSVVVDSHMDLYLTVCHDPLCADYSSQMVAGWVRRNWDMALDREGMVYLVWADYATDEAVIGRCSDPDCTSIETADTGLVRTEDWLVQLAIAPDGYPMMTFRQAPTGLHLFNCLPEVCDPLNR